MTVIVCSRKARGDIFGVSQDCTPTLASLMWLTISRYMTRWCNCLSIPLRRLRSRRFADIRRLFMQTTAEVIRLDGTCTDKKR